MGSGRKKIIRSKNVVFHENQNITNFEKSKSTRRGAESVPDLIPVSLSLEHTTREGETHIDRHVDEPTYLSMLEDNVVEEDNVEDIEQGE